jgi:hypothetical protein
MAIGIHVHCIQDDFCLEEAVQRVAYQCWEAGREARVLISTPSHYWSGRKAPRVDIDHIAGVAAQNGWGHCIIECERIVKIEPAWKAETVIRNIAIKTLRSCGADQILIVDADELWYPDSLKTILVAAENHDVVYQSTVPVIGVPGYPVDGARDRGVCYLGPGIKIQYVRAAWMPGEAKTTALRWTQVQSRYFHFTLVRRTVEELIEKIRGGTHYGEKYYDFDRWISETLPRIQPGARDVSYFSDPQYPNFWPLVRSFTRSEWDSIPKKIHPLLAPPEAE